VRRNPFASSKATQPSSTPSFGATPRFQSSTSAIKDDILTSFDDDANSPVPGLVSQVPTGFVDSDDEFEDLPVTKQRRLVQSEDNAKVDHLKSSPLQHRQRQQSPDSKRRKTFHLITPQVDVITSSPPIGEDLEQIHQGDHKSDTSDSDFDEAMWRVKRTPREQGHDGPRFRSIAIDLDADFPANKAIFMAADHKITQSPSPRGLLPDVFTPSRRVGNREFVPDGNAELVRSWVLAVSAKESRSEALKEDTITISGSKIDASGRFAIVANEDGEEWLLPEQHQARPSSYSDLGGVNLRPGTRIQIKGEATQWSLNLDDPALTKVKVAACWELLAK
jgi:hypothetical protein